MCLVSIHPQQSSSLEKSFGGTFQIEIFEFQTVLWPYGRCIDNLRDLNFEACDYIEVFFGTAIYQMMGQVRPYLIFVTDAQTMSV